MAIRPSRIRLRTRLTTQRSRSHGLVCVWNESNGSMDMGCRSESVQAHVLSNITGENGTRNGNFIFPLHHLLFLGNGFNREKKIWLSVFLLALVLAGDESGP